MAAVPQVGEYWLYVPYGAKRLTIKHPVLGILRDYMYPLPIEKATVYVMTLVTGKVITTVEETIESQWLVINTEPDDAMVYIDNQFVKSGMYQTKLKPGSYVYRVESPLYYPEVGKVQITDDRKELNVKLKPAFGDISVSTEPEQDAKVIVDGRLQQKTTPCKTEPLTGGEHRVQVVKEMYQPITQKIMVTEGQTTELNLAMEPNFAEVNIVSVPKATIYINNQLKDTGNWQGRLSPGIYSLDARLENHKTAKQDIEVLAGDKRNITLNPEPIYGSLDVMTTPAGASISINGKEYGTTPNTVSKLLIGDYKVKLNKTGFASVNKYVTVIEGKSTEVNEKLLNGRSVTINSTPNGVDLFIDGTSVEKTPYNGILTFGIHVLRIESNGKKLEKTVSVEQTRDETSFNLNLEPQNFTETIKGVNFDMVAVKGGTFKMGSDNAESIEKPIHSVTLSDFTIAKTEVNQALWQAVMGNNPSNLKGDNLPVVQVSWNDVQEFLQKLSRLTGKTYSLPTEAQWEYACRAGTTTPFNTGSYLTNLQANYDWAYPYNGCTNTITSYPGNTEPVGSYPPNDYGLYDMHGNVWEWCSDWYGIYSTAAQTNPKGAPSGTYKVIRGGGWYNRAQRCRSASRMNNYPEIHNRDIGFRVAYVP
jgi:formylglycine-generating enzyme required for sulfatase activity